MARSPKPKHATAKFLSLIVPFIFYWTIMSTLVVLFSPILIPLMFCQIFVFDFKYWNIYKGIYKSWIDIASGKVDIEARERFIREELGRQRTKKAAKANTFREGLDYCQKIEYDQLSEKIGYDPDADPQASHKRHPYKPNFKLPEDITLRDNLRKKWKKKAYSAAKCGTLTKSFWDMVVRDKVEGIFFEAYSTTFFTPVEITNEIEHLWLVETCSLPYYDVEYHLEMLLKLQSKCGNKVTEHREFKIRYKILHGMLVRLRERDTKTTALVGKVMDAASTSAQENLDGLIDTIFAWTRANQETNLFLNQCKFFERENQRAKNNH